VEAAAVLALAAMVLTDLTMTYQPLRDLGIYLKAGHHFLDGVPVYLQSPMTERPADLTNYPFVYPPLTLPFFALLAMLPVGVAQAAWVFASAALALLALRVFGLRWRWALFAALWPPLFQGLWVGNVAPGALALFALGPWLGAGLVAGAVFKSYTGIAALWLVRERRWTGLVWGIAAVVVLVLLTLPLTGLGLWQAWVEGLVQYQASQANVPVLYGFGLPKFVPIWIFGILAVLAILAALRASGQDGLARLGTATIVASPSLWGHGLLVAVPSLLALGAPWLWLAIGLTSVPDGLQWWWAVGLIVASWFASPLRRPSTPPSADGARPIRTQGAGPAQPTAAEATRDWLHPLPPGTDPWPATRLGRHL
jgi:hypothetical protein